MRNLAKNQNIRVMKPDKGTGIVVIDTAEYLAKMEEIISDTSKFELHSNQDVYQVCRYIERKVRNYLRDHVKKPGHITQEEYSKLYPNGATISVLYGLPKVHKQGTPTRPICSAVGSATYDISKYVAGIIRPAASSSTDIKDTFQFVEQVNGMDLTDKFMVSYDVRSLFTNVPLAETIDITMDRLYRSDHRTPPEMPEFVLRNLLELCVCDNFFLFNGKVYKQIDGVAMGNSLGPILANIFMAHLEEEAILNNTNEFQPAFYRRYVDDTFCVFNNLREAEQFLEFMNGVHPSMSFDMETEVEGKLGFLDTWVQRTGSGSAQLSTKVKHTDRGLFYHIKSFVPDKQKFNLVYNLVNRIYRIASNMTIFDTDFKSLKQRLLSNGFPARLVCECADKVLTKHRTTDQPEETITVSKRPVTMCLPFLGPLSYAVKRDLLALINKFYPSVELRIVFSRGFKIRNLFAYKDRFPSRCRSMLVYYTECSVCGPSQAYLGKTKNSLYERFYTSGIGHLAPNNASSALLKHLGESVNPHCSFEFDDVKIVETGTFDEQIRFIESILLKYEKQTLNTQERSIKLNIV